MCGAASPQRHLSCGRNQEASRMQNTYFEAMFLVEDFEVSLLIAKSALATVNYS